VPEGRSVGAQLVGDQQFRRETLLPQQLAHQPERRALVAPALNQHIEDLALMIDGAPQVHPLARDPDHHLVQHALRVGRAASQAQAAEAGRRGAGQQIGSHCLASECLASWID